jgi:Ca-activated chloride channel homolog
MLTLETRVTEGTLKTPDGRVLPLQWTKVQALIAGPLATVEVRQSFKNNTPDTLEATYLFPLPHGASVFRMEFRIGGRVVKGLVKEKEEARRAYQAARSEGRAATLLEQERPNLFTLSVANIAPDSEIEVLLEYQELVTFDQGEWRFVFPMVASERYHSGPQASGGATSQVPDGHRIRPPRARSKERVSPISLNVKLSGLVRLQPPRSPSHKISVEPSPTGFSLTLSDGDTIPNKDFVLAWTSRSKGVLPQIWFERKMDKPGTFCVCIPAPKIREPEPEDPSFPGINCGNCGAPLENNDAVEEVAGFGAAWRCEYCGVYQKTDQVAVVEKDTGKDVVFLIDQSASMRNLDSASRVVLSALEQLEENDAFRIIGFHHQLTKLSDDWLPCHDASRQRAQEFLSDLRSRGGTELEVALRAAAEGERSGRTRVVVLITDATVGNEGLLLKNLPTYLGKARLYVLGLGPAVNRYLIDKLALNGRGAWDVAVGDEPEVLTRFARRVAEAGPVLTEISVTWADGAGMDIYPRGALELFSGQSIRVTGRYFASGPARLVVTGKTAQGNPFRQELMAVLPEHDDQTPGLERVWARQRIDDLQDQLTRQPERLSEVRLEVLGLALKHQLMSPYTALVAEDSERSVDPSAPARTVQVELAAAPRDKGKPMMGAARARGVTAPGGMLGGPPAVGEAAPAMDMALSCEAVPSEDFLGSVTESSLFGDEAVEEPCDGSDLFSDAGDSDEFMSLFDEPSCEPESEELFSEEVDFCPVGEDVLSGIDMSDFLDALEPEPKLELQDWGPEPEPDLAPPDSLFEESLLPLPEPTEGLFTVRPTLSRERPAPPPVRGQVQGQSQVQEPTHSARVAYSAEELSRAREMVKGRLDLVFLIDETGSMGAYIEEVQAHLQALIKAVRQSPLCRVLRLGLVTFRDHPPQDESFVTRVAPLTEDIEAIRHDVNRMRAQGGGDGPEAVTDGLHELLNLNWDPEAARLVVMVGDAPPHGVEPAHDGFPDGCPCGHHWYTQAESCREMGITVHTVGCQGIGSFVGAVAVFQSVASTTGGLYLPLDHSHLLIGLVTGLADREFDRQRLAQYVREVFAAHQSALDQADTTEQVRFITETLQARDMEVLDLKPESPDKSLEFRPVNSEDVRLALQSVQPVHA